MSEETRGYSMPLWSLKKEDRIALIVTFIVATVCMVGMWFLLAFSPAESGKGATLAFLAAVIAVLTLSLWSIYFAQVHFVPEGVAVTLWGVTLRRIPAEKIRLIVGSYTMNRGTELWSMGICDFTMEELTAYAISKTPKFFRNSREFRPGEWADDYFSRGPVYNRRILTIAWEPERLQALQKLYPHARWVDISKDQVFDKQLEALSSEHSKQI